MTRSPGRKAGVAVRAYRAAMAAGALVIVTASPAALLAPATASPPAIASAPAAAPASVAEPGPLFGVTVDNTGHLADTVSALAALPDKATTRVYFDVREPARYYATPVRRISRVSAVMGELLDSSDEKAISVAAFQTRVESYLRTLGGQVSIWEIGNEVNGNWTGPYPTVAAKLTEAYDDVAATGAKTALTLYANNFGPDHCGDGRAELTPVQFSSRYVPARVRAGISYLLLSYYPTQCGGREPPVPQLRQALRQLHRVYPGAALGFGEVGLPSPASRATLAKAKQIMRWAYALNPGLPYYIGGYFWWYAAEDVLHPGALLRMALRAAFRAEAAALG